VLAESIPAVDIALASRLATRPIYVEVTRPSVTPLTPGM
jgi:hypothetical protein